MLKSDGKDFQPVLKLKTKKQQQQIADEAAATAERQRAYDLQQAEKFMQLDDKTMQKAFNHYRSLTNDLKSETRTEEARRALDKIINAWGTWDTSKLTAWQQNVLYHQYTDQLPKAVKELLRDASYGRDYFEAIAHRNFKQIYNYVADVIIDQAAPQKPMPLRQGVTVAVTFPSDFAVNTAVNEKIATLHKMWQQAQQQVTTVEDRFFLDQLAKTYLPDMWRMYQPFSTADSVTQRQAARLVSEQLDLLIAGVRRILDNTRSTSLGELKAHKTFLSQRLMQEQQLALTDS